MKVRAIARGYYAGSLKEVGDVFEATGKASWFVPEGSDTPPKGQGGQSTGRKPGNQKDGDPASP